MKPTSVADAGVMPHQLLAAYVVKQALADLHSSSVALQLDARRFLDRSRSLHFWCDVAGLDFETVAAHAERLLHQVPPTGFGRAA